jgi:uncharacterized alpha-E superfamily protein
MIPRARSLSDAFWWGRQLERFYLTMRLRLATQQADFKIEPGQSTASERGWGLLCTGQWDAFHQQNSQLNPSTLQAWWVNHSSSHALPAQYQQLRSGLRTLRGDIRSEWFEQWNRYQELFEHPQQEHSNLTHPIEHAVFQLYPMMLGLLEIEQGHTLLTHWIRLGIEWERLDMTVRLILLVLNSPDIQEQNQRLEWISTVQQAPLRTRPSVQDWVSNRHLVRSIPWLYARLFDCMAQDNLLARLVLPIQPMRIDKATLIDYQQRLFKVVTSLESAIEEQALHKV